MSQPDHYAGQTVYVITSDASLRAALGAMLVGATLRPLYFAAAEDFLAAIDQSTGGCVVTDLHLPLMNAEALIAKLAEINVDLPVIVLSNNIDVALVVHVIKQGACDFLPKPISEETLLRAVFGALESRAAAPPEITANIEITPREREVLEKLCAGKPTKRIAYELTISVKTVEHYRQHLMQNFNAVNVAELVYRATSKTLRTTFPASQIGIDLQMGSLISSKPLYPLLHFAMQSIHRKRQPLRSPKVRFTPGCDDYITMSQLGEGFSP